MQDPEAGGTAAHGGPSGGPSQPGVLEGRGLSRPWQTGALGASPGPRPSLGRMGVLPGPVADAVVSTQIPSLGPSPHPPAAGNTCSQRPSSSLGHRDTPGPRSLSPWVGGMAAHVRDELMQGCRSLSPLPQFGASVRGLDCPVPVWSAEAQRLQASQPSAHAAFLSSSQASLQGPALLGVCFLESQAGTGPPLMGTCPLLPRGHRPGPGSQFGPLSQPPGSSL